MAVIAVLGASSIVPFFDIYKGKFHILITDASIDTTTEIRNLWRCQLLILTCIPTSYYLWNKHKSKLDRSEVFTLKTLGELIASSALLLGGACLYFKSSDYTIVSHTVLLANTGGVLIVIIHILL